MGRRAREDVTLRAAHLREAGRLLWPEPAQFVVGGARPRGAAAPVSEFVLVPSAVRPRLLVPGHPRTVAAGAVRRYTSPSTPLARLRLRVLSLLMASGVGQRLLRARVGVYADDSGGLPLDTIETYLRDVLGSEVHVSLHIGPARANRKPILQVLDSSGETRAFVKVGINDLTRRLVRAEAASLSFLADVRFETLVVPAALHHGQWRGNEVLVQRALPTWERTPTSRPLLLRAMRELAEVRGTWSEPLACSEYWQRLRRDVATLENADARADLEQVLHDLQPVAEATTVELGSWHGDWTPWNMACREDRLMVWDWERFTTGVPVGFDTVHYDLQEAVTRGGADPEVAVQATLRRAAELLDPMGVGEDQAGLVASSYLVEIAVRYLQDGQAEAGARLGRLGQWLLPVLVRQARVIRGATP